MLKWPGDIEQAFSYRNWNDFSSAVITAERCWHTVNKYIFFLFRLNQILLSCAQHQSTADICFANQKYLSSWFRNKIYFLSFFLTLLRDDACRKYTLNLCEIKWSNNHRWPFFCLLAYCLYICDFSTPLKVLSRFISTMNISAHLCCSYAVI